MLVFLPFLHEVLKVSYCDRSLSVVPRASSLVRCQQFALKAYSSYTTGAVDSKLARSIEVTCKSKIAEIVPTLKIYFSLLLNQKTN